LGFLVLESASEPKFSRFWEQIVSSAGPLESGECSKVVALVCALAVANKRPRLAIPAQNFASVFIA
jgi:hypothetical protein